MALRSRDEHDCEHLAGPVGVVQAEVGRLGSQVSLERWRGGMDRPVSASLCYCGFCRCCQRAASASCKKGEWEDVCVVLQVWGGWGGREQTVMGMVEWSKLIAVTKPREWGFMRSDGKQSFHIPLGPWNMLSSQSLFPCRLRSPCGQALRAFQGPWFLT